MSSALCKIPCFIKKKKNNLKSHNLYSNVAISYLYNCNSS